MQAALLGLVAWAGLSPAALAQKLATLANRSLLASAGAANATFSQLRFSKAGSSVLVHITAQSVATLLLSLLSRDLVTVPSYPNLHFAEGLLPVSQLAAGTRLRAARRIVLE